MQRPLAILLVSLLACACVSLPGYDQAAYENATSLKARTLALAEKSGVYRFSKYEEAVDELLVDLSAAYEYANGVEHNNESAQNWRYLIGDESSMVRGWVSTWRTQETISEIGVAEHRVLIGEAFDTIICLEANKRQLSSCDSLRNSDVEVR